MAENLVIESPDFDRISKGDPKAIKDGIFLLWAVMNDEIKTRIRQIREAKDLTEGGTQTEPSTASLDNYAIGDNRVLYFTGASNINLSGIGEGRTGRVLFIHVIGAGDITLLDDSASSFEENRILTNTGADVTLTTDQSAVLIYLNVRWRMLGIQ